MSPFEQQMRSSPAAGMNPYQPAPRQNEMRPLDAATRLPQTVAESDFPALRDMGELSAQGDQFVMSRRRGIEQGGAPTDLKAAYMKLPPDTRNQLADYMVNSFYQQQGIDEQVSVSFDQSLGTHIFKDPRDGKWKPLNDLGMDWQDAKDIMKYSVGPAVGAMAGAAGGMATGSPFLAATAALLADTTIAGGFRASDVEDLINEGLIPPGALSPGGEGAKESMWALGGSAVGGAIGQFGRRVIGGVDSIPLAVDVDRKLIDSMLKRYEEQYGDTLPDLPLDKKMALVAKDGSAKEKAAVLRVQSRRETLESSSQTKRVMLERSEKNKEDLRNGLAQFTQTIGVEDNPAVFRSSGVNVDGLLNSQLNIINNLEAPAKAELARYDAAVTAAYQDARKLADDILAGNRDPERLGPDFKGVFDAADKNFRENMKTQYSEIAEQTSGQRVFDIEPLNDELANLRAKMMEDARFRKMILGEDTKGLSPRQDIYIGGQSDEMTEDDVAEVIFGQAFRKDSSGLLLSDQAKREMAADTNFDYKAINSALLSLRKRIRELPRSAGTDTVSQLSRIEQVLEDVRDAGLREIDPQLAARQTALDTTYKLGKEALDRGIGQKLADQYLAPRPGMDGVLKPSTFRKLFQGDSGAETVRDIRTLMDMDVVMAGPNNPIDMTGVIDNTRRGLLGELKSRVGTYGTKGGEQAPAITPEAFEKFKSEYRDALEFVFPPEQLSKMKNFASMRRAMEKAEADVKAVKERVMDFPWGTDDITEKPALLMARTWPTGKEDTTKIMRNRQLRQAMRDQGDPPGLINDYRRLIAHDMMTKVSDSAGNIDPYKLDQYLTRNQELLSEWYTSAGEASRSGTEMVNGMKAYADIGKAIMEKASLTHADKDQFLQALNSVSRAYVGIFTTPGRILTAAKQMVGGASTSKEADFILNPEKYIKNQEFYEVLDSPSFRALNRAGGHTIINGFREEREAEEAQFLYP